MAVIGNESKSIELIEMNRSLFSRLQCRDQLRGPWS